MTRTVVATVIASAIGGTMAETTGGVLAVLPILAWRTYWALRSRSAN